MCGLSFFEPEYCLGEFKAALSEIFGPHRVLGRELSEFLPACVPKRTHRVADHNLHLQGMLLSSTLVPVHTLMFLTSFGTLYDSHTT